MCSRRDGRGAGEGGGTEGRRGTGNGGGGRALDKGVGGENGSRAGGWK